MRVSLLAHIHSYVCIMFLMYLSCDVWISDGITFWGETGLAALPRTYLTNVDLTTVVWMGVQSEYCLDSG
jgi:hypothetical protein